MWKFTLFEVTKREGYCRKILFRLSFMAAWYDMYWGLFIDTKKRGRKDNGY